MNSQKGWCHWMPHISGKNIKWSLRRQQCRQAIYCPQETLLRKWGFSEEWKMPTEIKKIFWAGFLLTNSELQWQVFNHRSLFTCGVSTLDDLLDVHNHLVSKSKCAASIPVAKSGQQTTEEKKTSINLIKCLFKLHRLSWASCTINLIQMI